MSSITVPEAQETPWYKTVPYEYQLIRTDLKTLIASVLWGIVITILLQIGERLDTAIFGGAFFVFAILLIPFCVGYALFGLPGAFITGWIGPIFATLLASAPLGPWFFLTNGMYMLFGALVFNFLKKEGEGATLTQLFISGFAAAIGLVLPYVLYIWPVVVGMTPDLITRFATILVVECTLFMPLTSFFIMKRALKTRLWP